MRRKYVKPEEMPRYVGKTLFLPIPEPTYDPTIRLGVMKLIFNGVAGLQDGTESVFQFNRSIDEQPYLSLHMMPNGVVPIGNYNTYLFRNFWHAYAYTMNWRPMLKDVSWKRIKDATR